MALAVLLLPDSPGARGSVSGQDPLLADSYKRAIEARQSGKTDLAFDLLGQVLRERPDFPEARFELGLLQMERGLWREAEEEFRKYLTLRPGSYEAHNNLAVIYAQLAESDALENELIEVTRLRPGYAQGHVNLGDYYLGLALRSLWEGYRESPPGQREKLRTRILRFLAADPASTEDRFVEEKIARVTADLSPTPRETGTVTDPVASPKRFEIQVYSGRIRLSSEAFRQKLRAEGFSADLVEVVMNGVTWYRVRVGPFPSPAAANIVARQLVAKGLVREYWIIP